MSLEAIKPIIDQDDQTYYLKAQMGLLEFLAQVFF